jgi:hypothetical protein
MRSWTLALVALLLFAAAPAQAAGPPKDRIVVSGAVDVRPGQTVTDVVIADGPVTMRGRATGDVVALHGRVFINGPVSGDVVALQNNAVTFGPRARVQGDLTYRGREPARASTVVAGDVNKANLDKVAEPLGFIAAAALWVAVTISTLVLGLLLLWIAPRAADVSYDTAEIAVGRAIAWGIGLFIGIPLLAVIALITIVGIPFGIGLLLALLPIYAIGYVTSGWLLGRRLVSGPGRRVLAFLAGWGILRAVAILPVLGGLVWLAATVFGLGVLAVAAWRARAPRPVATDPAA